MKQIKALCLTTLLSIGLLHSAPTLGAETSNLRQGHGTINDISLSEGRLVVSDAALVLKPGYTVKNNKGEVISAFNLRRGMQISVTYAPTDMVVKEIIITK